MSNEHDFFVGLDVGSHKVLCVVARPSDTPGRLQLLGHGVVESKGIRKGVVADLEAVVQDIRRAVEEAHRMSGIAFTSVWAAIGGSSLSSENCSGTAVVRGSELTMADIKTAQRHAYENSRRQGKRLIKLGYQGYRCCRIKSNGEMEKDISPRMDPPSGLICDRVEAHYHTVYGSVSNAENMKRCLQRSGLDLGSYEPHPWAAAMAVTRLTDRQRGVAVFDIGAETTSVAVYDDNVLLFTDVQPFGAEYFTRDISCDFDLDLNTAEELKLEVGCCTPQKIPENEMVYPIGSETGWSRRCLAKTLESRAEFFADKYRRLLAEAGLLDRVNVVVLTGGGAGLKGLKDVVERTFACPVRVSGPLYLDGDVGLKLDPSASVAVGVVMAAVSQNENEPKNNRVRAFPNVFGHLKTIFIGDY